MFVFTLNVEIAAIYLMRPQAIPPENPSLPHSGRMTEPIRLLLTRLCSILNKLVELGFVISQQAPQILAVTKCWLDSDVEGDEIMLPDYKLFRQDRQIKIMGGGVLI